MGECGCGATDLNYVFPGPDGITYGIEVYSGCHYCDTPAGVVLHRFTDDEMWAAFTENVTTAPFLGLNGATEGWGEVALTVISREGLIASMNKNLEDYDIDLPEDADVSRLVQDAVHESSKREPGR